MCLLIDINQNNKITIHAYALIDKHQKEMSCPVSIAQ